MTRTFSKIHGLANARIGWAYAPPHIVDALERVRGPFNTSGPAIAAGAAALKDRAHIEAAIAHNDEWLSWLERGIASLGLRVTPSVANFLLIHFPDEDGKRASDADAYLRERGLVLRCVAGYGFPNSLRLTVGSEEANRAVVAVLSAFMGGGDARG